jgi:hypothetical protein
MGTRMRCRGIPRIKPRKHPAVVSERWRSGVSNERKQIVEAPAAIIGLQYLGQVFTFVGAFAIFRDQMIAIASLLCLVQVVIKRC